MPDVTGSNISVISGNATMVAGTATFKNWMDEQWIRIPFSSTDAASGDNQWYQMDAIGSSTLITLKNPYTGTSVTNGGFTLGQVSILPEDYQDLPLYRMAIIYFTTRFPDAIRAQQYQALWDIGEAKLNEEFGSKTISVVLTDVDAPIVNPNLFPRTVS